MERAEYYNDTRPTQTQLDFTETSKVDSILRRQRATAQLGIVNGFITTPNSVDATLIDIGPGEGYTGGLYRQLTVKGETAAERISSDTPAITGQALADYTNGVQNYISLVYSETTDTPLAEVVFPFLGHDTLVHETYSVEVLTAANWALLTIAQLRLRILVAIVTARGAGVSLTSADIQQVVQPKSFPTATNPVNITGVAVSALADSTLIGSGTLRWEVSTKKLYWTAPGDTEGLGVTVSTSGSYTLQSATTTYWIMVYAISASLPVINQTDTILIQSLYGTTFPRYSATDLVHREMVGSGEPTVNNPHGLTINDLGGGGLDHAGLFHVNGISVGADANQLAPRINTDPAYNQVLIRNLGGRPNTFLIAGTMYTDIKGVSSGSDAVISFDTPPKPASGEFMAYLDDAANLQIVKIGTLLWSTHICLVDIKNTTAGNCTITWNATTNSLTYQAQGDGTPGAAVYLMGEGGFSSNYGYYKLYSSDTANWVIVFVDGTSLGGNNSTTFATLKSEITNADASILKIGVFYWDLSIEDISNMRDIRQWGSADWRDKILEEHDENGHHTKVFQNPIRAIAQTGPAISAYAVAGAALELGAPNSAVVGSALTAGGLVGLGAVSAVAGIATSVAGIYGSAPNQGVVGVAATAMGGSFSAPNSALVANAATAYGIYATAHNTAGYFTAATQQAIYASAPNNAVWVNAATVVAMYASAPATAAFISAGSLGLYVNVTGNDAVYAAAQNTAGYFVAGTNKAIYASAPNTAGYFVAAANFAIYASAAGVGISAIGNYGIVATGDSCGGWLSANTYGIYGVGGQAGGFFSGAGVALILQGPAHGGGTIAGYVSCMVNGVPGGIPYYT